MKFYFVLAVVVGLLLGCTPREPQPAEIVIELENAHFDQASLMWVTDMVSRSRETLSAERNEEGVFVFQVQVDAPDHYLLTLGTRRLTIFLDAESRLEISADMDRWDESLSFAGDHAAENLFLVEFAREVEPRFSQRQTIDQFTDASPVEFTSYVMHMFEEIQEFVNDFHNHKPMSPYFKNFFLTEKKYQLYSNLVNYPYFHQYYNQLDTTPELPESYWDFLEDALVFEDHKLKIQSYAGFWQDYLRHLYVEKSEEIPQNLTRFETDLWLAEKYLQGKPADFVKASLINFQFNHGSFEDAREAYKTFAAQSTYENLVSTLETTYQKAYRVSPGKEAPGFTLTNLDGQQVSLEDFRGKVVYLDFWASWCPPCIREIPHAKELKKRFEHEDELVFLYVSVDDDVKAWKSAIERHNIQGVHLHAQGMQHEVPQSYNVQGIPSFFLIDRQGVIYDNNPDRPSGERIDEQLKTALAMQ